jgi:hypothetical protein
MIRFYAEGGFSQDRTDARRFATRENAVYHARMLVEQLRLAGYLPDSWYVQPSGRYWLAVAYMSYGPVYLTA